MRFKKAAVPALCFLLTLFLAGNTLGAGFTASAKSVSQLQDELEEARANSDKLAEEIRQLEQENASKEKQQEKLKEQIASLEKEVALYNEQIAACDEEIAQKEEEISAKEQELEENKELFKQRLVAMYTSGSNNQLEVLLSAEDFGDYLAKTELVRSVTEHDAALLSTISKTIEEITSAQKKVEESKAEKTALRKELSARQAELQEQYLTINEIIYENEISKRTLEQRKADEEESERQIQQAIKNAQQSSSGSSGGSSGNSGGGNSDTGGSGSVSGTGQFIWPLPGYTVSSPFGMRYGKMHKGIDISGNYTVVNKPILAADSGRVITVGWDPYGYGNYVMVDHGSPYVTLYAHMSRTNVSVGQNVQQGDTLGFVGNTGNSQGAHLHFEIRKNGEPINPMQFF